MVELREITEDNFNKCIKLSVADNQRNHEASNVYSLAQAWVYRNTAFPFAIYADDILVGFIMLGYYEVKKQYNLWRFMIDEKYQGKGYGKQALLIAIYYLVNKINIKEVYTSVVAENTYARKLYNKVGFVETGELSDDEIVMKLII